MMNDVYTNDVYVVYDVEDNTIICICRSKEIAYREVQEYLAFLDSDSEFNNELSDIKDYVISKDINFFGEYVQILEKPFYF